MDFPTIDADIYGKIKVLGIISILKDSKNFVKLKIVPHGVSNFKVLIVTLILDHFLGRRDGKDWLHAHLVQRAG